MQNFTGVPGHRKCGCKTLRGHRGAGRRARNSRGAGAGNHRGWAGGRADAEPHRGATEGRQAPPPSHPEPGRCPPPRDPIPPATSAERRRGETAPRKIVPQQAAGEEEDHGDATATAGEEEDQEEDVADGIGASPGRAGNALSMDAAAFTWAFGPVREGKAAELLGLLDDDLVENLRKDFRQAHDRLAASKRGADGGEPRGKRIKLAGSQQVRNSLAVRVAIGTSFIQHKEVAVAHGERDFVKSFIEKTFHGGYNQALGRRVRSAEQLVHSGAAVFRGEIQRARRASKVLYRTCG